MKRVLVIGADSATLCAAFAERFFGDNEITFLAADEDLKDRGMGVTEWQNIDGVVRVKHIPMSEVLDPDRPVSLPTSEQLRKDMTAFWFDECTEARADAERNKVFELWDRQAIKPLEMDDFFPLRETGKKRAQWKQEIHRGRRR